jgi:TonB family protein
MAESRSGRVACALEMQGRPAPPRRASRSRGGRSPGWRRWTVALAASGAVHALALAALIGLGAWPRDPGGRAGPGGGSWVRVLWVSTGEAPAAGSGEGEGEPSSPRAAPAPPATRASAAPAPALRRPAPEAAAPPAEPARPTVLAPAPPARVAAAPSAEAPARSAAVSAAPPSIASAAGASRPGAPGVPGASPALASQEGPAGGGEDRAARPAGPIRPSYPPEARWRGQEADVVVEAWVGTRGDVERVSVLRSAGEAFDGAALRAVHAASFHPALRDGRQVASRVALRVHFRIDR